MARLIGRAPLAFAPGAQRLYSSAGFSLLARVLELATEKSYAQLLHELVLDRVNATDVFDATESEAAAGLIRSVIFGRRTDRWPPR